MHRRINDRLRLLGGVAAAMATSLIWLSGPARAAGGTFVTCQSNDHHYTHCAADTGGGVELTRQLSRGWSGRCEKGESWGWDRRGIWVNNGCRAVFFAYCGRQHRGPGDDRPDPGRDDGRWGDGYGRGRDFGHHGPAYDRPPFPGHGGGHGGGKRGGGYGARASFTLDCSSQGYRRSFCYADTSGGVALVQQFSNRSGECREGRNWGVERHGIWVDKGCRARFRLWPAGRAGHRRY